MSLDPFLGRVRELRALREAARRLEAQFIPIYGRRRVGKTELIGQFLGDQPALRYSGRRAEKAILLRDFLQTAATSLGDATLAELTAADWPQALRAAYRSLARARPAGRRYLVLDEFQWLCHTAPDLPDVLKQLWETEWKADPHCFVILCGSYVGFMEREVLGAKSPVYGLRTGQLQLQPFGYREAALFHPDWSVADQARAYFLCGGVPYYLRQFQPTRSIAQNIIQSLLEPFGVLHHEPDFLLREELADFTPHASVLDAIAHGAHQHKDILAQSGLAAYQFARVIEPLTELRYVERREPLAPPGPAKRPGRTTRYHIRDPLLRFWYRFVGPHLAAIENLGAARACEQLIAPQLEGWFGLGFEDLCREALPALYAVEQVPGNFHVGEYWSPHVQVDVIGVRSDRRTDLAECKWGSLTPAAAEEELRAKLPHVPLAGTTPVLRLFLAQKPRSRTAPPADLRVHTLEELYALE